MKNIYGFSGFIIAMFISIGLIIACGNKKETEVTKEETKEETKKETTEKMKLPVTQVLHPGALNCILLRNTQQTVRK